MKRKLIFVLLSLLLVSGLFAQQGLQNNEFYRKSLEFTRQSEEAFDNGEYDKSAEYAIEAQKNAALSKQYIEEMTLAYRARTSLYTARARIEMADRINLKNREPELYAQVTELYKQAGNKFNAKDYQGSIDDSQKIISLLEEVNISAPPRTPAGLAKYYEVKLKPGDRDCLWKIAGFDFVYGDSFQWKRLYEHNKNSFPDPNNPNLIVPGQILEIPSIKGEARSGTR